MPSVVTDGLAQIAQYRVDNNLPEYQQSNTSSGTVARMQIGGTVYWGSNKVLATRQLTDAQVAAMSNSLGLPSGMSPQETQFFWHAEFEALWKAKQALGTLPEVLTMYVDRPTCWNCTQYLPYILKAWGVKELFVYWTNGSNLPRLLVAQQ